MRRRKAATRRASVDGSTAVEGKEILLALNGLVQGDFSIRLPREWTGLQGKIGDAFNLVVERMEESTNELSRLSRAIGQDGRVSERFSLTGEGRGAWLDRHKAVNSLIDSLVHPISETARVIGAVAKGDLSRTMSLEFEGRSLQGEFLRTAKTLNTMVEQLSGFASEVTRVAREVGTEGKLGGQARVDGVSGTWKDLTENVNLMASNLTSQVRNIAGVTTAVATGDLTKKITVDVRGEFLELKDTINTMVDQLRSFASEVTRVAREVGTEGKLGGQARVEGISGTWKDLTDSVNFMAGNLTAQVRNIAAVTTAVANGDLSKKITVDVKGEILELKNTINTLVDQLSSFASEVTRVAREVGTEGRLGGQATVAGVAGTWKDLTDSVNSMASNLTNQVRNIAEVTTAVATGDLSKKITVDVKGEILELKDTINTMVDQLRTFASEVTRVAREVGSEGRLGGQANARGLAGTWKDLTDNVNSMASNLTAQVRNIAAVTTAVATGDLTKKITVDVKGEILELKVTINTMVDQLRSFASEVTRVAREVGTEGILGGQATVEGVSGTWRDLTDSVNFMALNLTNQVRGIAKVVTAVANGDLERKLFVEAKGEVAQLAETINNMIETLATFADQVTTVAREVGVEGKLGGQASVPGAAGTWKGLTENVNGLAANLTNQVRAIADVATAVTKGDLTRSIQVEARGEVAALKDNINEMIRNLKDTTIKNSEQDWLKTNLAKFTRMLQGQKELGSVGKLILSELARVVSAQHGVFYVLDSGAGPALRLLASYGFQQRKNGAARFHPGEGLVGQCVLEKERILVTNVPENYVSISSGLGTAAPFNLIVLPVLFEGSVKAVLELAAFDKFSPTHLSFLDQLTESLGIVINTIEANSRTEDLLKQSQSLAKELQSQQEELRATNEELAEKASLLARQNAEVETKNKEIEQARQAIEEKAAQLGLTSRYKSEFLANMSHELRTPLNSILLLAEHLAENSENHLVPKEVEYARTIHSSGQDLLSLISDILDLSKIESGTVTLDLASLPLVELQRSVDRDFRTLSETKRLDFVVRLSPSAPASIMTDENRLKQVLKNLLSNAFKFTERGRVSVDISTATTGWPRATEALRDAKKALAFNVTDTGIGIEPDKQKIIFEAFKQADSGTSRRYGGTGLGLAISRELAHLLGGEIQLHSALGEGSTFTLFLPLEGSSTSRLRPNPAKPSAFLDNPLVVEQAASRGADSAAPATDISEAALADEDESPAGPQDKSSESWPGRKILLVDDDIRNLFALGSVLETYGLEVLTAESGREALERLGQTPGIELILLDIMMPEMDGFEVIRELRGGGPYQAVPIIALTAKAMKGDGEKCLECGASDYLPKPVSTATLVSKLGFWLSQPSRSH